MKKLEPCGVVDVALMLASAVAIIVGFAQGPKIGVVLIRASAYVKLTWMLAKTINDLR